MGLFVDQDGHNIKFFIQKDLDVDIQAALTEAIQVEDGRIEPKMPIKGYVLVKPDTREAVRLYTCWAAPHRPERHFVPYTWVDACREAGMILRPIFVQNGQPVKMHIHSSIANLNSRETIAKRVLHSGGDPNASEQDANVILADRDTDVFSNLVKQYQQDREKYIESHLWVKKCIDRGIFVYTPTVYKNPGGRRAGDERTSFTEDDEANLCGWIASVIPYKEAGGRTGNKIYQELVSRVNEPGWAWVARHTWQSWRERYKKNSARLDEHIAAIVNLHQPARGGKGQYGYIRQPEEKRKVKRKRSRKSVASGAADQEIPQLGEGYATPDMSASGSANVVADDSTLNESQSEWPIRVGEGPPPEWAKRKAEEEAEGSGQPMKKFKASDALSESAIPLEEEALSPESSVHPIDQGIESIANEYRFLPSEVRAFYDKHGDMSLARERFAKMREIMNALS